jgi:membrane-bound metal-dependent hydrolase YbcI (DUF457 family)
MAFPAAHSSLGWAVATVLDQKINHYKWALFWALVSFAPDFDFFFVFILRWDRREYHRTFTHSIIFCLLLSLVIIAAMMRLPYQVPNRSAAAGLKLWSAILLVLLSHVALDYLCVSNPLRDGEMLFWPFSRRTFGHRSFLVPLYHLVGTDPTNTRQVAVPYTVLELVLWSPVTAWVLWKQKPWKGRSLEADGSTYSLE